MTLGVVHLRSDSQTDSEKVSYMQLLVEVILEQAVRDAANAEGWLDDARMNPPAQLSDSQTESNEISYTYNIVYVQIRT